MVKPVSVVIAGGGTGGHAFPALALAKALTDAAEASPVSVRLVGTVRGPEGPAAAAAGIHFEGLDVVGFRRSLAPRNLAAVSGAALKGARATLRARRILKEAGADVAVGTGAYASIPVAMAAALARIPLVLHEQNALPGRANRLAGRWASAVAVSFPETARWFRAPVRVTGNPVRPELAHLDRAGLRPAALAHFGLEPQRRTLLVFGGSQGARRINEAALGAYPRWRASSRLQVLHLVGSRELAAAEAALAAGVQEGDSLIWRLVGFTDRMDLAYAAADLTVCRAGAATLFEIAAAGLPAIVVPYPYAGDHQRQNTEALVELDAIRVLPDPECTPETLASQVDALLADPDLLAGMGRLLHDAARPDAAADLAALVLETARAGRDRS